MYETLITNMKNSPVIRNDTQVSSNYPHHKKTIVGTKVYAWNGYKIIAVFWSAYGEASWLLFPSPVYLISGGRVQQENN